MVCGKVTGTIVSTRKVETLVGSKFLEVELYRNGVPTGEYLVAIDRVGSFADPYSGRIPESFLCSRKLHIQTVSREYLFQ